MADDKTVEHHWHEPKPGQVVKAVRQMMVDMGFDQQKIAQIIQAKVAEVVTQQVATVLASNRFDQMLVAAVASYLTNQKQLFDRADGYGMHNRIHDLIQLELQRALVAQYEIKVTKREPKP